MLPIRLGQASGKGLHVLAIGAHSDDIEIGCGGTILRLAGTVERLRVSWVVLAAHGERAEEASASAEAFLASVSERTISIGSFRDSFFPYTGGDVKEHFETLKGLDPDVILTHHGGDRHQDHRVVAELTWNTFRDHLILEYEIPKYDGDLGQPNVFVPLQPELVERKLELLRAHFATQSSRRWFTDDLFTAVLRLRGMECNSPSRFAEAFHCRKLVI